VLLRAAGVLAAALVMTQPASASTDVSGTISGDQVWTQAASPYRLVDNVTLARGSHLRLEPGVEVRSAGRLRLNVVGTLQGVGTPADPITLSVGSGLRFYDGSIGSELAWATIRDSIDFGISTELDASNRYGPWPSVRDVVFRDNRFAMYAWYPAQGSASVTNSRFINNSYGIQAVGGNFTIDRVAVESDTFGENTSAYLSNNSGQRWTISRSNLLAPASFSSCSSSAPGCTVYVSGAGYPIDASGVWWGTTDANQINARIYDGADDPSRSVVSKDPIANSPYDLYPPTSAPRAQEGAAVKADVGVIAGTASDDPRGTTGLAQVDVSFKDLETGLWWNGAEWAGTEQFRTATCAESWSVSVPSLADGHRYGIRTLAHDSQGNTQFGATSVTILADGTPPQTSIESGPTGTTNDSTPTFAFSANEAGASFECRVDTAPFAACTSPRTTETLSDGAHGFDVRAIDQAGNVDPTAASRSFTVDTAVHVPPTATSTVPYALAPSSPAAPAPGKQPTAGDVVAPSVILPPSDRTITAAKSRSFAFKIGPPTEDVRGAVRFETAAKVGGSRGMAKRLAVGTKSFNALKGQVVVVTVKLPTRVFALVRRRSSVRVRAAITLTDPTGNRTSRTYVFGLRAPRR